MAQERLVPLSVAPTLPRAILEWEYLGGRKDYRVPVETCQLCCEHPLRYHFHIKNQKNRNEMWVGSGCIDRFGIRVVDESGNRLSPEEGARKLESDKRRMREEARALLEALDRLAEADPTFDARTWKVAIGRRDGLTPGQRAELLARFEEHGVEVAPSILKLARRRAPTR
jgi:hypothetical protein